MSLKERLREKALELGFEDCGFTGVEPLELYIKEIDSRSDMYDWVMTEAFNVKEGAMRGKILVLALLAIVLPLAGVYCGGGGSGGGLSVEDLAGTWFGVMVDSVFEPHTYQFTMGSSGNMSQKLEHRRGRHVFIRLLIN